MFRFRPIGYSKGSGYGYGIANGSGYGYGIGNGSGDGNGSGYGSGDGGGTVGHLSALNIKGSNDV